MTDYAVEIGLGDHRRGDRWPGIASIGPVTINGAAPVDLLARVRMQFRHVGGSKVFRLDSELGAPADAHVVIDDAASDPLSPLPVVEGVAPVAPGQVLDPVPTRLLQLVAAAPDDVWAQVEAVEVDADGQTWMRLRARPGELDAEGVPRTDGGRIRLGDLRAVDDQVVAVATLLGQVDLTDLDVADLRVPDSFVVTRTGPVDGAAPGGADTDGGER